MARPIPIKAKPGAGRPPGALNCRSKELITRLKEKFPNFCPLEEMVIIAQTTEDEKVKSDVCSRIADYIYPRLKATDITVSAEIIKKSLSIEVTAISKEEAYQTYLDLFSG